jgi:hypothetical protein
VSKNNLTFILFELLDNGLKFSTQDKKIIIEELFIAKITIRLIYLILELGLKGRAKIN